MYRPAERCVEYDDADFWVTGSARSAGSQRGTTATQANVATANPQSRSSVAKQGGTRTKVATLDLVATAKL